MSGISENSQVNMTDAENRLWGCLCSSDLGIEMFQPQYVVGSYTVDFCSPQHKLIVEVDDPQALEHDEFYVIRNAWLEAAGWRLLRFTSHDTLRNTNGVLSVILSVVRKGNQSVARLAGKSLAEMMDFEI